MISLVMVNHLRSSKILIACILVSVHGTVAAQIVSNGYQWPEKTRAYWPTERWIQAPLEEHRMDPQQMAFAHQMAVEDEYLRALLIIKDGLLVFENYYHGGAADQSTEIWSVTKSIISALVGIALGQGRIGSVDDPMVNYMSSYPEFGNVTSKKILTQTTGLEWAEEGDEFVAWLASDDWIKNAVTRQRAHEPGVILLCSSGNSHFLSGLIYAATGSTPGQYAQTYLFQPTGIEFVRKTGSDLRASWERFLVRTPDTWKLDPKGIEVGAFGLSMTARDMARFGFLYLNKGNWDGREIVPESWVEESARDHVLRNANFGFGYNWVVSSRAGQLAFNADGWGGQIICVVPALDMVVVIKSNAEEPGNHPCYEILAAVIEAAIL